jgi:hypothetical protein
MARAVKVKDTIVMKIFRNIHTHDVEILETWHRTGRKDVK